MRKAAAVLTVISFVSFCLLFVFYIANYRIHDYIVPLTELDEEPHVVANVSEEEEPRPGLSPQSSDVSEDVSDNHNAEKQPDEEKPLPKEHIIRDVPLIMQEPELPRGCEVTSLAMLLNYLGVDVDKMTLAEQIKKDETPRRVIDGVLHWGDPRVGFVGDMYNMNKPGYGVYHAPVYDLLAMYVTEARAVDITGCEFETVERIIASDIPVWIITNGAYAPLHSSVFTRWQTENGEIEITYREHSVLITGYDEDFVYFNDPQAGKMRADKGLFIAAWKQMGSQALSVE